jgi:hypothetical protein
MEIETCKDESLTPTPIHYINLFFILALYFLMEGAVRNHPYIRSFLSNRLDSLYWYNQDDKEKLEIEKKKEVYYEYKYMDKYNNLDIIELDEERLNNLKISFIYENTPLGNVMMSYDNNRKSFVYYADHNIPYRYLETIARKYVIMNNCKSIYKDFKDELSKQEKEKEIEREREREREELLKEEIENEKNINNVPKKKNVFANFKKYNKESAKPSQNKSSKTSVNSGKDIKVDNNIKKNINVYANEGRFSNFLFTKKIKKEEVDNRHKLTFADFKKLNNI